MKNLPIGASIRHNPWTLHEDSLIAQLIKSTGHSWPKIATKVNDTFYSGKLIRSARQVREHWINALDPRLTKDPWTASEEARLIRKHARYGNKWARIAKEFSGRNENQVKNHWYQLFPKKGSKIKMRLPKEDLDATKENVPTNSLLEQLECVSEEETIEIDSDSIWKSSQQDFLSLPDIV